MGQGGEIYMSPERSIYEKVNIRKEAPSKKVEYSKPKNWGVANNKRLSNVQYWRK